MDETYTSRVAAELRAALARRGMKQGALAVELGVSDDWLSRRLRGVVTVSVPDLDRICSALAISSSDVLAAAKVAPQVVGQ